jgi:hypothetical protein
MPNVHKLYDIPIKPTKKERRSDQFGQFDDTPPSPQLIARFPLPLLFAVSIAASGCRFSLPFCRAKYLDAILLCDENKFRD